MSSAKKAAIAIFIVRTVLGSESSRSAQVLKQTKKMRHTAARSAQGACEKERACAKGFPFHVGEQSAVALRKLRSLRSQRILVIRAGSFSSAHTAEIALARGKASHGAIFVTFIVIHGEEHNFTL